MNADEPKAVSYTGNDDDEVVVNTTDEAISMWDRIENMQAAGITVGEVKALRAEIAQLRALITAWADAEDALGRARGDDATVALRKAVGR